MCEFTLYGVKIDNRINENLVLTNPEKKSIGFFGYSRYCHLWRGFAEDDLIGPSLLTQVRKESYNGTDFIDFTEVMESEG